MSKKFVASDIPDYLSILKSTLRGLEGISGPDQNEKLRRSPVEGEWSIHQIVSHLCSCQDVWTYSIYVMLAVEIPHLSYVHPRQLEAVMKYEDLPFSTLFSQFQFKRLELLRVLENLADHSWTRVGTIKGREHTVFSQVRRMALHEREHWEQIEVFANEVDWAG